MNHIGGGGATGRDAPGGTLGSDTLAVANLVIGSLARFARVVTARRPAAPRGYFLDTGVAMSRITIRLWGAILLVVWSGAAVGCGAGGYSRRLEARVKDLKENSEFNQLQPAQELPGTRVSIRVPKYFEKPPLVVGQQQDGVTIEVYRVKPPVLALVEHKRTYEAMFETEDGSKLSCYCYIAASEVRSSPEPTRGIANALSNRYPESDSVFSDVDCLKPDGGLAAWKHLRSENPQVFYTLDAAGQAGYQRMPGVMEIYCREEQGYHVTIVWRSPKAIERQADLSRLAKLVAGSVTVRAEGEPAPSAPPPAPPGVLEETYPTAPQPAAVQPSTSETSEPTGSEPAAGAESLNLPVKDPALVDQSMGQLERIGEALLAFHDKEGRFPAAAAQSADGKPLLSWRVALLPYLGAEDLFTQFRLDEPWDSPHNKPLAQRMPAVFQTPGGLAAPRTCYLAIVGPGTLFGQPRAAKTDIRDGLEKTLVVVEVDPDQAVVWTQPSDWKWVPATPTAGLGKLRGDWFIALAADTVPYCLKLDADPAALRGAVTIAGGEATDLAALKAAVELPGAAGPGTPPTTPAQPEPATPTLLEQARQALAAGREREALLLLCADGVARDDAEVLDTLRWSPALKQPALANRWAVAVRASTKTPAAGGASAGGTNLTDQAARDCREKIAQPLVAKLQKDIADGHYGRWLGEAKTNVKSNEPPVEKSPGLVHILATDGEKIDQLVREEQVELVLTVEMAIRTTPRTGSQAIMQIVVSDSQGKRLWTSRDLNSTQVQAAQHRPGAPDPLAELIAQAVAALQRFHLTELPEIPREAAQRRAETLAASTMEQPLPALLELRYYQSRGLLDEQQLASLYERLVGNADDGSRLAGGAPEERLEIVRRWLPKP